MSTPPTGNSELRNEVVRISELTVNSVTLEGLTFQNCKILGPAVLLLLGRTTLVHSTFDAPNAEALFWEIPPSRALVVGAVSAVDCTFSACRFEAIGLGGPPEMRAVIQQGFS